VGNESNVRRYWPCPELVPTAAGEQVAGQLLPAGDLQRLLSASDVVVTNEYTQSAKAFTSPGSPRNCVGALDSGLQEEYGDSGFKKRYGRAVSTGQPTAEISVDESVIEFDTPHRAADFVKATESTWQGCAHTSIPLSDGGSTRRYTFGDFTDGTDADDIAAIAVSASDGRPTADCSHAVAAKSNVVVDVKVCGSAARDRAMTIVSAIRDRFPKE
jgi:PknH-like extracellular domain